MRINGGYAQIEKGSQCLKSWYAIQLDVVRCTSLYMGSWDAFFKYLFTNERFTDLYLRLWT